MFAMRFKLFFLTNDKDKTKFLQLSCHDNSVLSNKNVWDDSLKEGRDSEVQFISAKHAVIFRMIFCLFCQKIVIL